MAGVLQAASAVKLVDVTRWRVITKKCKGSLEACYIAGRNGNPSRKFGLDQPQIDRFTKTPGRGVLIAKLLTRVTAKGTTYFIGVGTDDREERWEEIGAQLEALEEIAALTR